MLILIALAFITYQTAIYEFNANNQIIGDWEQYNGCGLHSFGTTKYYGLDANTNCFITRIFENLESHSHLKIEADFVVINHSTQPYLYIDEILIEVSSSASSSSPQLQTISQVITHNRSTAWIRIHFIQQEGLVKLTLSVVKCQYECIGCIENYPILCQQWKLHQYSFNKKIITNSEGWSINTFSITYIFSCGNCQVIYSDHIKYSTKLPPHQHVLIRFYKYSSDVITINYIQSMKIIQNTPQNQFVEILIHDHLDSILYLTITSSSFFLLRDFEIFYTLQDRKWENWIEGCLEQVNDQCLFCQEGWIQDEYLQHCNPSCGNNIIQGQEQCDDGNQTPYDGCFNCKFQCSRDCSNCQYGQCLTEHQSQSQVFIETYCFNDPKKQNEYQNLDYRSFDYYFINFGQIYFQLQEEYLNQGISQQVLNIYQNCKLKELISRFGYYKQNNISVQYCIEESNGKCQKCQLNYQLSFDRQKCLPLCNDGIIIVDEICDDQNNVQFDGCYKCQLSCDINCLNCIDQKCYFCEYGWELRNDKCYQNCGDGLVALNSIEQCDDGNQLMNDGCFSCKIECIPNCLYCLNTQICLACQNNYYLEGESCLPICGDGFVISGLEQCEDGNDEPYDGCFKCQYQCQFGCLDCYNQQFTCNKCDSKFILDNNTGTCQEIQDQKVDEINKSINIRCDENFIIIDNQCVNQCGNGLLNQMYEQCDDGNQIGGDGCSFICSVEDYFQCRNYENSTSICSYVQSPNFQLQSLSNKMNQTQIIELTFTQKVKVIDDIGFEEFAVVEIIPQSNAAIYIKPIVNLSTTLDYPIYQIVIEFIEPVEDTLLQIDLVKSIIRNEQDLELAKNQEKITLGKPFVLSETAQNRVTQIVHLNDAMIYSMISISGLSLLTGNAIMFFNLLDLLQSLSYIKYMQYPFPPHLIQFLNTYTKVSLKPILDYLKIDELLSYLNGGILPIKNSKSQSQSQVNQLNEFYLMNAKSCYFSIFGSILTLFICSILTSQLVTSFQQTLFQKFQKYPKYLLIESLFLRKVQFFSVKFKNEYFSFGIAKIYFAILHQFLFSGLLQFPDYSLTSPLMIFNSINAIIGLGLNLYIWLQLLSITSSNYKNQQKWKYFFQDSKNQFWASNFRSFQIYRIMFYIFIIVEALNYPEIQSILLSMFSLFYLGYLIKFRPLQSNYEYAKLISREILFILITGSFLIYSFEINYDNLLLFGWVHIGLFSVMLISNLIIDIVESIKKAWINYKKKQQLKKLRKVKKYFDNPLQKFITLEYQNKNQLQIKP